MVQIKFSSNELTELQSFYRQEYNKAVQRLQDIKAILSKLNSNGTNGSVPTKTKSSDSSSNRKRGRKPQSKTTPAPTKKLGKWGTFIVNEIKSAGKPVKTLDIYPSALKHFNAKSKVEQEKTLRNLRGHIRHMGKVGILKTDKKKGQRAHYFSVA